LVWLGNKRQIKGSTHTNPNSLIRKLKDNKSPGPDNIGPKLVKCMEYALEYIFNIYLNSGKVMT